MALSGSEVTRFSLYGGIRGPWGDFSGKAVAPPVFAGTIADISVNKDSGTYQYDYSSYFTGATSYSISPAVETGWSFNTSTCVLTIDTDDANIFGPYIITATNAGGTDDSNAFSVTVVAAYSGGYIDWGDFHPWKYRKKPRFKYKDEEEAEVAPILEDIAEKTLETPVLETDKDLEIVLKLRLRLANLEYKATYMQWLREQRRKKREFVKKAVKRRRKQQQEEEAIIFYFLN